MAQDAEAKEPTPDSKTELSKEFFDKLEAMLKQLKDFHLTEKGKPTPDTLDKIGAGSGLAKNAATSLIAHNDEIEKVADETK